jgi:hypothetical protein
MGTGVEAERLDARNAALAVGALLVATVLVLAFRWALLESDVWAWVYVAMDLVAIGLAGLLFLRFSRATDDALERDEADPPAAATEHEDAGIWRAPELARWPYPALRGVYTISALGVLGALAEFGDQLFS